jgi:stage V sporulation protein B
MRLRAAGFAPHVAIELYGVLTGFAMPFVIAPTIFTSSLSVSLLPSIAEALALGDGESLRARAATGLRVTVLLLLPAAAGLMLLGRQIPLLFFHSARAGLPLIVLAPTVLFMGVQQVTSGILQGLGCAGIPMRNLIVGGVLKLGLTWFLVSVPAVNVDGAALGTTAAFLVAAAMNVASAQARVGGSLDLGRMLAGPALAVAVMGLAVRAALAVLGSAGLFVATAAAIVIGAAVYALALLAVGGVRAGDLELIPRFGSKLAQALRSVGLIRP